MQHAILIEFEGPQSKADRLARAVFAVTDAVTTGPAFVTTGPHGPKEWPDADPDDVLATLFEPTTNRRST